MTEREKMLAGQLYDCGDTELLTQWHKAKDLISTSIFALSRHLRQYGCSGISGSINGQKATAGLPHTQHLHSEAFIGFRRMSDSETGVGLLTGSISPQDVFIRA